MVIDIRMFERTNAEFVADIRAEYATGRQLSQATIERLLCECDANRVVMDGPSEILDLGRSTRTPSDKQFKALIVRDGHCQAKGCNVPWQFCQPHHINWWTNDGPTRPEQPPTPLLAPPPPSPQTRRPSPPRITARA
jgi:hypothetical protein